MIISDLNYLEAAVEVVEGGTFYFPPNKNFNGSVNASFNLNGKSTITSTFTKNASVSSTVHVQGTTAQFAFSNEAFGPNSIVQTDYIGVAIKGVYSSQEGVVVAAA